MPDKFNMQAAPFDRLTRDQQHRLRSALDVAYFRAGDNLIEPGRETGSLHIIIKGAVEERSADDSEIFAHYAPDDLFDVRALLEGRSRHRYQALEDTLCYLLPKEIFSDLYHTNPDFAACFDTSLAKRQQLLETAHQQKNLAEFILTKVDKGIYHPVAIFTPDEPLDSVTRQMKEMGIDSALIRLSDSDPRLKESPHPWPYGIVTRTNMLHAVMLDGYPLNAPMGEIATYPVHFVKEQDFLFNALISMTRHRMKRVMVCDDSQPVGMLDMTQILSSFSTHSHVLTLAIARADSTEELAIAASGQRNLVESLVSNGIRTRFIMELISAVNEQIIEKAFELEVPPQHRQDCCLMVLGSEGRGEQVLKTDQDNALILKDGVSWPGVDEVMARFTHTLQQLGYPLCPGQVMVSNPDWVKNQTQWKNTLSAWVDQAGPEQVMKLAIMADAHAVAGNRELLIPVRAHLLEKMSGQELILAEFTRPALQFSSPLTLFGNVKTDKDGLEIKQGGIFPVVHGVRALSLDYALDERNTFDRLDALVRKKVLERDTADNLSEALKLFVKLRLHQQLSEHQNSNRIDIRALERSERDVLRHSLHVVKKFKQWLGYHYQIRD